MKTSTTTAPQSLPAQRYATAELENFRQLLAERLANTDASIATLEQTLLFDRGNGTDDTSRTSNMLEDGQASLEREEAAHLLSRQLKYRTDLTNALARVANGTYGICRVTGQRIPAERLRAVPTATQCIEAKLNN
ncbi:MAG TPA: TraR/DksA C4-type zinc finger protein [Flavobacteriales bacterium]|nr:TraR/DksA C4-type zinc finger protein [Flavobacteriales bacterium]